MPNWQLHFPQQCIKFSCGFLSSPIFVIRLFTLGSLIVALIAISQNKNDVEDLSCFGHMSFLFFEMPAHDSCLFFHLIVHVLLVELGKFFIYY